MEDRRILATDGRLIIRNGLKGFELTSLENHNSRVENARQVLPLPDLATVEDCVSFAIMCLGWGTK